MSDLDRELEPLRREEYGGTFPAVAAWLHRVEAAGAREPSRRQRRVVVFPAVRLAATLGVVVLLAVACAIPVRVTETLGHYATVLLPGTPADAQARVAALPWVRDALVLASGAGEGRTTLYLASPRADRAEVERWARDLAALPGAMGVAMAPLRDEATRPAYAVAGRALFGTSFPGAGMSERERMGRILALARELASGSVVVVMRPPGADRSDLVVYPQTADSVVPVNVMLGDAPHLSLLVLRRNPGAAEPDTIWIRLDAGRLRGASDAERTALVREALRRRGIDDVKVRVEAGVVHVTTARED